jgi:K(+)-stimulated pyrophosphate-energized sodium pump
MSISPIFWVAPAGALVALAFALFTAISNLKRSEGTEPMKEVAKAVRVGAMAYLKQQYKGVTLFFGIVFVLLCVLAALRLQTWFVPFAFLTGGFFSGLSGFIGMSVGTRSSARTTWAAKSSLNSGLRVAFSSGLVMGLTVVGLGLIDLSIWYVILNAVYAHLPTAERLTSITSAMLAFGIGASSQALFARVGGGIFTKAADVGADLVGKVEAGIPEDDHRNPAVIADNVGDNVGDVAGMGADLFESYASSLIGCAVLGVGMAATPDTRMRLAFLPIAAAAIGILASLIGTLFVRMRPGSSPQKALNNGSFGAAGLAIALLVPTARLMLGDSRFGGSDGLAYGWIGVTLAAVIGLAAGTAIGIITEYFTGTDTKPVKRIVKSCDTGPATTIISGLGVGMQSTMPPVLIIGLGIWGSFSTAGLYGIGIAGLGMLLTLGIQLSVDAYGPIADNAGGLASMSELPPETREITDSLDAVGNTTAAIGKGFAIGSAALTSLTLLVAFISAAGIDPAQIAVTNPGVLIGMFIGAMIPFLFSSMAMDAISVAAFAMIEEVRRQFRQKPGILKGTEIPDYRSCVDISTRSSLKRMILPGVIAIVAPLLAGIFGGPGLLTGLLAGATVTGVLLAIFMSNAGGAWDNAKKLIESRQTQGKGSNAHMAAVVGDTVGDPFKDTAGPSLNILIKLMAIIALVTAPLMRTFWR